MTEQVQNELNAIVKTIVDTGMASKIILFGSMACGELTPDRDSDIDLCVLTPITDRRPRDMKVDLRMAILDIQKTPLDLLMYNQEKFVEHASRSTSFEYIISTQGRVLYER
ncbi:MAG: nucleotidyltransferase domain-containing protein [Oscillospiraceae bacterium]|nr:nucleotidyltransferase domain-containing protein [Oscillospiraceae bacterium]